MKANAINDDAKTMNEFREKILSDKYYCFGWCYTWNADPGSLKMTQASKSSAKRLRTMPSARLQTRKTEKLPFSSSMRTPTTVPCIVQAV